MAGARTTIGDNPVKAGFSALTGVFARTMREQHIEWNQAGQQWFCVRCLRSSDHSTKQDADRELSQFECKPPEPH
jgi:hypothetical protein